MCIPLSVCTAVYNMLQLPAYRDLVHEEHNLELVLTKAFLEVDKAFEMHLNASGNGKC